MKKLKILTLIIGIMISSSARICSAEPPVVNNSANETVTRIQELIITATKSPYQSVIKVVKNMETICLEDESKLHAKTIADCFKCFVYALHSRRISSVELGTLRYFYHNVLIKHFEMSVEELEEIKDTIEHMPNVTEHKHRRSI
ncbi:MAG: hypothetical protein Q4D57_00790 [Clostridia bacterium]|nr:hypothetical protein [Clostridia bacterium]